MYSIYWDYDIIIERFSDLMLLLSSHPTHFLFLSTGAAQDFGVGYHWTRGTCPQSSRGGEWQEILGKVIHFPTFSQENLCWLGFIDHLGGGGGSEPLCNSGQSDQLPSLHHQSDEQECRWCHRPGQEERWAPTSLSIWRVLSISKPSGNIQGWITTMEEHSEAFDLVPLKLGIIFKPGQARQILWTGMHCSPAKNKNNNTASMTQLFLARQQTMTSWWLGSRIRARELQWNYICLF